MPAQKTHDEFITDAIKKHGNKYSYELTDYVKATQKIRVSCPKHGCFEITPASFLSGRGCRQCGTEATKLKRRYTTAEVVEQFKETHGDRYDYSKTNYINNTTKILVTCKIHGDFEVSPSSHKLGINCYQCGLVNVKLNQKDTYEEFVSKSQQVHGQLYDYSEAIDYKNNNTLVKIICPFHGVFVQLPTNHKSGKGCNQCNPGGYSSNSPGYLYVLQSEDFIKVGITNRQPSIRARQISNNSGEKFTVHTYIYTSNGVLPQKIERKLLLWLRENYKQPEQQFNGSTECFSEVTITEVLNMLTRITQEVFE